ncbi:unnamed protein product, partial [Mesorhabditis spiculigera]
MSQIPYLLAELEKPKRLPSRDRWGNYLQFILTCVGYAVGLGNVWRFPYLAYHHGGAAFLLPYICCNVFFGMPLLYLEFSLGQYLQRGPGMSFFLMKPILQGIGWAMAAVSLLIGQYYNVIISWILLYLKQAARVQEWTKCEWDHSSELYNPHDNEVFPDCISVQDNEIWCREAEDRYGNKTPYAYNHTCWPSLAPFNQTITATQIFLDKFMLGDTKDISVFGQFQIKNLIALIVVWLLVVLILWKGVAVIGSVAYVTATVPYFIIAILFARGIMLDGASIGIEHYLLRPDMAKLTDAATWKAALSQVCFSMSVGVGGLQSMASYNEPKHNTLRTHTHPMTSGVTLAFVAYPEAISTIFLAPMWCFIFFLMLFLLGISTQIVYMETVVSAFVDRWPQFKTSRLRISIIVCFVCFWPGFLMCFGSGVHWLKLWDDFSSMALCFVCFFEIVAISYVYGWQNWRHDLEAMFGPPKSTFGRYFGYTGYYFFMSWMAIGPCMGALMILFSVSKSVKEIQDGENYWWVTLIGWALAVFVVGCIPGCLLWNICFYRSQGNTKAAFRVHEKHRSYARLKKEAAAGVACPGFLDRFLPGADGWDDDALLTRSTETDEKSSYQTKSTKSNKSTNSSSSGKSIKSLAAAHSMSEEQPPPGSRDDSNDRQPSNSQPRPPSNPAPGASEAPPRAPEDRERWHNYIQYILTCIGYVVGLGNVWRFPYLAYQNGGAAFLFVYLLCNIFFGLPLLYLEFSLGQYLQAGPGTAFHMLKPVMQGVGWSMVAVSFFIAIHYNVVIAWIGYYMTASFSVDTWSRCEWYYSKTGHHDLCVSAFDYRKCVEREGSDNESSYWSSAMETCLVVPQNLTETLWTATNLHLSQNVLGVTGSITDFGEIQWQSIIAQAVVWGLVALILAFGLKAIGLLAYIAGTIPYIIMAVLVVRAVMLEGSWLGIQQFIWFPDGKGYMKLFEQQTWEAAITQVCFSLSVGLGGVQVLASYNDQSHDTLMDSLIVVGADILMSLLGATAVFGVLGHLASVQHIPFDEIVSDIVAAVSERWELKSWRPVIGASACLLGFLAGIVFCTGAGSYWLMVWDQHSSMAMCFVCFLEVVAVIYVYGWQNWRHDLEMMFGAPETAIGRYFGYTGYFFFMSWMAVGPCLNMVRRGTWTGIVGWCLPLIALAFIPGIGAWNIFKHKSRGDPSGAYRAHPSHPSYKRLRKEEAAGIAQPGIIDWLLFPAGVPRKMEGNGDPDGSQAESPAPEDVNESPQQIDAAPASAPPTTPEPSAGGGETTETKESEPPRDRWGNWFQFILTCIGYSVGLGNVWRFPYLAYENGGAAFLFPYIFCNIFFGMPLLYFEMSLGQYLQAGPSMSFYKCKPILQGIGWCMALVSFLLSMYYNVIVTWIALYLTKVPSIETWTKCGNSWNDNRTCIFLSKDCAEKNSSAPINHMGKCVSKTALEWVSKQDNVSEARRYDTFSNKEPLLLATATEQFWAKDTLQRSAGWDDLGMPITKNTVALAIVWILEIAIMWKGVSVLGYASYLTATLPYIIMVILFFRGVTLPGAKDGVSFYLLEPKMEKLLSPSTWKNALSQVCFSLSVGMGGLGSMASYNQPNQNTMRDAIIVASADAGMSIFGGVAAFSVVGYIAHMKNIKVEDAVASSMGLAFIAYPEAISTMDLPWLWAGIFFLMLFLLGASTQLVYIETVVSAVVDRWPKTKEKRIFIAAGVAILEFTAALIMMTGAGIYWLNIWDKYCGTFALCIACATEALGVMYIYGWQNWRHDLETMFGPPKTTFSRYFGFTGYYFFMVWMAVVPALTAGIIVYSVMAGRDQYEKDAKGNQAYYPWPSEVQGWILGFIPVLAIPVMAWWNWNQFKSNGQPQVIRSPPAPHPPPTPPSRRPPEQRLDEHQLPSTTSPPPPSAYPPPGPWTHLATQNDEPKRERWGNWFQFILTCIGFAVGLGNVWRFPYLASEHGGASFLFPYLCCNLFFGMPLLYFEMSIGQYLQSGPSMSFFKYKPVLQGIGWTMTCVSFLIGMYYNVLVSWIALYLINAHDVDTWTSCQGGPWNVRETCISLRDNLNHCKSGTTTWYIDKCVNGSAGTETATEQYLNNYILRKTNAIDDFGGLQWKNLITLSIIWIIVILILWKGVKIIGVVSYITATVPYFIIAILFFRGVTMPNAWQGIRYYLFEPDIDKVLDPKTWKAALSQVCFSLSVGMGALQSMSSYNDRQHNLLRDALLIGCADASMSLVGGVAVFSVVGSLAAAQGKAVKDTIKDGMSLAFIAYPEAISTMDWPWLWAGIFFLMLFLLGISTQLVFLETVATAVVDQWPRSKPYRLIVVIAICFLEFIPGVLMCSGAGIYWLGVWDKYVSSFALCAAAVSEIIGVIFIYGWQNYRHDLETMFGPPKSTFGKYFGFTGYYFFMVFLAIGPCMSFLMVIFSVTQDRLQYGEGHPYPMWTETLGWLLGLAPVACLPAFAIWHIASYRNQGDPNGAFRVHPTHTSYRRLQLEANAGISMPGVLDGCLNGTLEPISERGTTTDSTHPTTEPSDTSIHAIKRVEFDPRPETHERLSDEKPISV